MSDLCCVNGIWGITIECFIMKRVAFGPMKDSKQYRFPSVLPTKNVMGLRGADFLILRVTNF